MSAGLYQVQAMPTFVLLHNRRELGRVTGTNLNAIESLIVSNLSFCAQKQSKLNENAANSKEKAWLENFLPHVEQVYLT